MTDTTNNKWVEIPSKYGTGFEKIVADGILRIYFHARWCTYFYYIKIVDGKRVSDESFSFGARVATEQAAKQHLSRRYANRHRLIAVAEHETPTDEKVRMKQIVRKIADAIYDADPTLGNPIYDQDCEYVIGNYLVLIHVPMYLHFATEPKKSYRVSFGFDIINKNDHPDRDIQASENFDSLEDAEKAVNDLCRRAVKELVTC